MKINQLNMWIFHLLMASFSCLLQIRSFHMEVGKILKLGLSHYRNEFSAQVDIKKNYGLFIQ